MIRNAIVALVILLAVPYGARAQPPTVAAFPAEFYTTSLEPVRDVEMHRLQLLDRLLRQMFEQNGLAVVDTAPVAEDTDAYAYLWSCNGCEIGLARRLGTQFVAVLWVQKVSNLILNINLRISDVDRALAIAGGSVDIRGNTDESWTRGLRYLLKHRIFANSGSAP